jgi:hypothetical protein
VNRIYLYSNTYESTQIQPSKSVIDGQREYVQRQSHNLKQRGHRNTYPSIVPPIKDEFPIPNHIPSFHATKNWINPPLKTSDHYSYVLGRIITLE